MDLQLLTREELLNEFYSASDYYNAVIYEKSFIALIGTLPYIMAKRRLNAVLDEMNRRKQNPKIFPA